MTVPYRRRGINNPPRLEPIRDCRGEVVGLRAFSPGRSSLRNVVSQERETHRDKHEGASIRDGLD
jgi:hypothetical protein